MRFTFKTSDGDTFENCLSHQHDDNQKFIDRLLSTELAVWQQEYCENKLLAQDDSDDFHQILDIYRDREFGFFLRLNTFYRMRPMRILYAWNERQPTDKFVAVHLRGGGMVYPAQLFHPTATVESLLRNFVAFALDKGSLGTTTWISTDCISGEFSDDPNLVNYMRFTIDYEGFRTIDP